MSNRLIIHDLLKILSCPVCKSNIMLKDGQLVCQNSRCGLKFPIVNDIVIMLPDLSEDFKLTQEKWNEEYRNRYTLETINLLNDPEVKDAYAHVKKYWNSKTGLFLEAGCGPSRLSCLLAKEGIKTVGIDLSLNGLFLANNLFNREGVDGFFVCGDILRMPFRDNTFSFIYTGGVLEHIRDVQGAVKEMYRCLLPGGFTTNTVPHISLSTPYRIMRWGNIPDIPLLRSILEFIEVNVLNGKYMRFGYEKSFTSRQIRNIFGRAGFRNLETGLFKTHYPLETIPYSNLKKLITRTVNSSRFFWPMIYVNGEK